MSDTSAAKAGQHGPAKRRILLIDDLPSIHEDFRRILSTPDTGSELDAAEQAFFGVLTDSSTGANFDVDSAYQGRDALDMVRSSLAAGTPYALAFVDMRMPPGWDGVETIRQIWQVDPRLQIVICTAHSDYSWDEVLGKLGAEDRLLVLKKPFDTIEVAQLACALTAKWDLTRQAELKVIRLEEAVSQRTRALEIANKELETVIGEMTQLATHDALTGLPNRLLFADRASQALAVARRERTRPTVLMLDLDRFKEVNDTLGHLAGDQLLTQVSTRLLSVLRPGDTVARFGGDEFAMLLPDAGPDVGTEIARRIARALEPSFALGDVEICVEASIGIAAAVIDESSTLEDLLRQADIAMFEAKADRSGFAHFASCTEDGTPDRLTGIGELRQALDCEELVVYYQPKMAIDSGELLGVEALVRWQHPVRGLLLPSEFIELAEGSTLIRRLTMIVLDSALRCSRTWLDQGVRLPVAVNVSSRSLSDSQFPKMVRDRLTSAGIPAEMLTIELTEGTVMARPGLATRILEQLRAMGVQLSIDDYGIGYSSIAYLKNLRVTELKIDRTFMNGLTADSRNRAIVRSATELGHNLGLSVVAEGVEDEATLTALASIGVDIAQGYHLGHPMPEDVLRRWIESRPATSVPAHDPEFDLRGSSSHLASNDPCELGAPIPNMQG